MRGGGLEVEEVELLPGSEGEDQAITAIDLRTEGCYLGSHGPKKAKRPRGLQEATRHSGQTFESQRELPRIRRKNKVLQKGLHV